MGWNYHWRATPAVEQLERDLDALRSANVKLQREVKTKQGHVGRLKVLVQERSNTIDDLRGKLEQSRAQCRRLDEEAERLAEMVRLSP